MKKILFLITGVTALGTMSFMGSSEKVELVQTEKGLSITNMHLLSLEDLKLMEEITVVGAKTTKVFNESACLDVLSKTVISHEDVLNLYFFSALMIIWNITNFYFTNYENN